jgi:Zn-dependent alcohol dehydrogenase
VRAAILEELGRPLVVEEVELLPPGPHEVVVRIGAAACGVCKIHGCQYGGAWIRRDIPRFASMLEAGLVDPTPIISRRYTLDDVNEAFRAAAAREVITGVVAPHRVHEQEVAA